MLPVFSNPRLHAEFDNWPLGGAKRGKCVFSVETNKKGSRILRTTTGKPKVSTYATQVAIVDGDDGKTYLLHYSIYGSESVSIYQSDVIHCAHFGQNGDHYHPRGTPHFDSLFALIRQANNH